MTSLVFPLWSSFAFNIQVPKVSYPVKYMCSQVPFLFVEWENQRCALRLLLVRLINRFLLFLHPPLRSTVPSRLRPWFAGHSIPLPETDSRGCSRQLHHHPPSTNVPHAIVASPPSTFLKHAWRGGAAFSQHGRNPAQEGCARRILAN